jgi:hypothetical protein
MARVGFKGNFRSSFPALTNDELRDRTKEFARELRDFGLEWEQQENQLFNENFQLNRQLRQQNSSQEDQLKQFQDFGRLLNNLHDKFQAAFIQRFDEHAHIPAPLSNVLCHDAIPFQKAAQYSHIIVPFDGF